MAEDCEKLSADAQKIFEKIKAYFPPDPWNKPRLTEEGRIYDNGWHDLRKSSDRKQLMGKIKNMLGYLIELEATEYRNKRGSLAGFTRRHFSRMMQHNAELLLLLNDLDFQIETLDFLEGSSP